MTNLGEHWKILNHRVSSLEKELKAALTENKIYDERKRLLESGLQSVEANRLERNQMLDSKYSEEIEQYGKQIKLAQEVLSKKQEERRAMLDYLLSLNLIEHSYNDLKDFSWTSIQRLIENISKPNEDVQERLATAEDIKELSEVLSKHLDELNDQMTSTEIIREKLRSTIEDMKRYSIFWKNQRRRQEARIEILSNDNDKLNLLVRQCIASTEYLPERVTRTIQAKSLSFLQSEPDSSELIEGLRKYKSRQYRIIELLRHKDSKLGTETNRLQVACHQTHDQLRFYNNLITEHRNMILNKDRVDETRRPGSPVSAGAKTSDNIVQSRDKDNINNQRLGPYQTTITQFYVTRAQQNAQD